MKVTTISATVYLIDPVYFRKGELAGGARVNSLTISAALEPKDSTETAAVKLREEIRAATAAILHE